MRLLRILSLVSGYWFVRRGALVSGARRKRGCGRPPGEPAALTGTTSNQLLVTPSVAFSSALTRDTPGEAAIAVNNAVHHINPKARVNPGHSTNLKVFAQDEE
jgi:hypothetical protein